MTRNLETADIIVKVVLAITVIVFYFTRIINGPFAIALLVLAVAVLLIFLAKTIWALILRD